MIFEQNLALLKSLDSDNLKTLKTEIQNQIEQIPKNDYYIKSHREILKPFIDDFEGNLANLSTISKLFDRITVKNYSELRFRLQCKKLQTYKVIQEDEKLQKSIEKIVSDILRLKKTISAVKEQELLLEEAQEGSFWLELDFVATDATANIIAPLMIYKSKAQDIKEYHFDLKDAIKSKTNININHLSVDLKLYEENIRNTIETMLSESPVLQKLFLGVKLSDADIVSLKNELLKEDIEVEKLSEMFTCKSQDIEDIFIHIINQKEYKLPYLLDTFLKKHTLNSSQIEFIKAIKHYVQEKHDIQRADLIKNPFTKFHKMGIQGMFKGSLMMELVRIIDDKKEKV